MNRENCYNGILIKDGVELFTIDNFNYPVKRYIVGLKIKKYHLKYKAVYITTNGVKKAEFNLDVMRDKMIFFPDTPIVYKQSKKIKIVFVK